jgi:hypothetical protein
MDKATQTRAVQNKTAERSAAAGTATRSPCPLARRCLVLSLALMLASAAGCATTNGGDGVIPVFTPVPGARVKPGGAYHALVVLPNQTTASIYLHFGFAGGRIRLTKVGLVNHNPDRVTLFTTKTRIYVDDGAPVGIATYDEFKPRTDPRDFHLLKDAGEKAEGRWLVMRPRFVSRDTVRGPTVVLFYSVQGHDGFIKVPYRALWNVMG